MFSGIIENIGTVKEYKKLKDYLLVLDTDLNFKDVKKGSGVILNPDSSPHWTKIGFPLK